MASVSHDTAHVKRRRRDPRRRRVNNRNPVSARLVLDHHIQGDVGILSDDLAVDLFPGSSAQGVCVCVCVVCVYVFSCFTKHLEQSALRPKSPRNVAWISYTNVPQL